MADSSRPQLWEFSVLHHPRPTKDEVEQGRLPKSTIVAQITAVTARSEAEVQILAGQTIPSELRDKLEEVEILTRPFVG